MKNKDQLTILFYPSLSEPVKIVFDDIQDLPFTSTKIKYINKTKNFEGIPCHLFYVQDDYIFIIHSKIGKVFLLEDAKYIPKSDDKMNEDYYEIHEDDYIHIDSLYIGV